MWKSLLPLSLMLCALGSLDLNSVKAQEITTDGTTNTTVNSDGNGNFQIEQGDRAGDNLFHSFGDFSVPTNGSAVFNNAADISNIFSRVTGGNISEIDGAIAAQGSANLFLINPAGIMFGNNARLDLGGSFFGTTADSILFEDGEFSATDLNGSPLLTVNAPIGLNFRDNPSGIANNSFAQNDAADFIGLEVQPGNDISLIGGEVYFDAGEITARGGRANLGGLSNAGIVTIEPNGSLTFPTDVARANVTFANFSVVDVAAEGGGSIFINANDISINGSLSELQAGILADSTSANAIAGDIVLNAARTINISDGATLSNDTFGVGDAGKILITSGNVELTGGSTVSNIVRTGAMGDARGITINANSLALSEGSSINTSTFGRGDTGAIAITTADETLLSSNSNILNNVELGAVGNSQGITVAADSFSLTESSSISAVSFGQGDAGDITLDVSESIALLDSSVVFSQVDTSGEGRGGEIVVNTADLSLTNGSQITTTVRGRGDAGNIAIDAADIILSGINPNNGLPSGILSNIGATGVGNAGNTIVNTKRLNSIDGARIGSDVFGTGDAGTIQISATDRVNISGLREFAGNEEFDATTRFSQVSSETRSGVVGDAGTIEISAGSLSLTDGGFVSSSTNGQGRAGNITIDVGGAVILSNDGDIFSNVGSSAASASASTIQIKAGSLRIADAFSSIETSTSGTGDAGNIRLNVDGTVENSGGRLSSEVAVSAMGNAGSIEINAASLNLNDKAIISSSTDGQGSAGNISIKASDSVSSADASSIFSQVGANAAGEGGEISLETVDLSLTDGSQITTAVFGRGNGGKVTVNASNVAFAGIDSVNGRSAGILNNVESGGTGNAGNIEINTAQLSSIDGARIGSDVSGTGNAGNITVNATDDVLIAGLKEFAGNEEFTATTQVSQISSQTDIDVVGNAGDINLNTQLFTLRDRAFLSSSTFGRGNAGNISISDASSVLLAGANGGGQINTSVGAFAEGVGGEIKIQTQNLTLQDGSEIITQTFGNGQAGDITLDVAGLTNISGVAAFPTLADGRPGGFSSGLIASTELGASATGGEITLTTSKLELSNGGVISARSQSEFAGGEITINADNLELNSGGQILTTAFSGGASGNINLNISDRLSIAGRDITFTARIAALTAEFAPAQVSFTVDPVNEFSGIFANTAPDATGNGGIVTVMVPDLELDNGGQILAETNFRQPENITPSEINLAIDDTLILRNNSTISAQAANSANGGNINIDASDGFVVAFPSTGSGSDIRANAAQQGTGGKINLAAEQIFGLSPARGTAGLANNSNDIDASSDNSILDGDISIETSDINPTRGATELSISTVEAESSAASACSSDRNRDSNTFVINGKGGIPPVPTAPLTSELLTLDRQPVAAQPQAIATGMGNITLARGAVKTEDGRIRLTATPSTGSSRTPNNSLNCG